MRALLLTGKGAAPRVDEVPTPTPGAGEARVAVRAAALNHRDVFIQHGQYPGIEWPVIPGSDGVGLVDAVGEGVDAGLVGQSVVIDPSLDWGENPRYQGPDYTILGMPRPGTFAEHVVVPAANVVPAPMHLDDAHAAALPLAWLTAWRALVVRGRVAKGERVLVTGAGGGVALAAVTLAVAHGAEVWVNSSDPTKIERAKTLGAAGGVLYTEGDWGKTLQKAAGGAFDVVVDGAGGEGFGQIVRVLGMGARVAFYGGTAGRWPGILPQHLFFEQVEIHACTMGSNAEFRAMVDFVNAHELKPVVDRVFPLADGAAAFARMEAGEQFGKLVLTVRD